MDYTDDQNLPQINFAPLEKAVVSKSIDQVAAQSRAGSDHLNRKLMAEINFCDKEICIASLVSRLTDRSLSRD